MQLQSICISVSLVLNMEPLYFSELQRNTGGKGPWVYFNLLRSQKPEQICILIKLNKSLVGLIKSYLSVSFLIFIL